MLTSHALAIVINHMLNSAMDQDTFRLISGGYDPPGRFGTVRDLRIEPVTSADTETIVSIFLEVHFLAR